MPIVTIRASRLAPLMALVLLVAEIAAFVLLVDWIGLAATILIGLATTVTGALMLRRIGLGAAAGLRRALDGEEPREGALLEGTLAALGAMLLILPGFLTDLVGLALAAPSLRGALARRFSGRRATGRPRVVDLSPGDWRGVDERQPRIGS